MRRTRGPWSEDARGTTLTELAVTLGLFALVMIGVVSTWTKAQEVYFVGAETAEVQQNVRAVMELMAGELRSAGRDVTQCALDVSASGPTFTATACHAAKQGRCAAKLAGSPTYGSANGATCPTGVSTPASGCGCVFAIPFADLSSTSIRVRADRNDNGTIRGRSNAAVSGPDADPGYEDVKYALKSGAGCPPGVGHCLTRDDGSGAQSMVAVDVDGFTLTYFPRPGFPPCHGSPIPNPCPAFVPVDQTDADNIGRIRISIQARRGGPGYVGQMVSRTMVTDVYLRNLN